MTALYVLAWFAGGMVGTYTGTFTSRLLTRRREKRFLRFVSVRFENAKEIRYIAVGPTEKETLAKLERQINDSAGTHPEGLG